MKRAFILGSSRGLGSALAKLITERGYPTTGFARKLSKYATHPQQTDFTKPEDQEKTIQQILEQATLEDKLFYVAGGGPYGPFANRSFKDHEWAWDVTFKFPAKLLHALAKTKPLQTILVGSAVAESNPDPHAASYAAAKHALKGLVLSLQKEYPQWDLRLFSPGYMDTDMLPRNAPVRAHAICDPADIARDLWDWSLTPATEGHKVYPKHP